ncbi:MAG: hypothetical protein ACE5ES_05965, partial [Candidatus Nanoarchaeia archaeon]
SGLVAGPGQGASSPESGPAGSPFRIYLPLIMGGSGGDEGNAPEEKENPEILEKQTSRISRIAKGSGVHNSDIRSLLKQYKMLNEMVKSSASFDPEKPMSQKQMMKLAKKFMKGKKFRI